MARGSLAARIRALEQITGGEDITVIIQRFGPNEAHPTPHYAEGDAIVERGAVEDGDSFRERALRTLRGGRHGIVVVTEHRGG